jgi:predicted alpha/beta-fold hydrolase
MPLISASTYRSPFYLFNPHLETVVPSIFRQVSGQYERERLELPDGDFLDLDWMKNGSDKLVIISHGLEGNSGRHYVKGMALYFYKRGWDALAWNCRGCSGEMNRLPRFYHHGATEDLAAVIEHAQKKFYQSVHLVGFSMGGSMSLKYCGERERLPEAIKSVVAFSVPCDLGSSARELDKPGNKFYRHRFLKKLEQKIIAKAKQFPNLVSAKEMEKIRLFREFDTHYTAPLHGFSSADDFYTKASSGPYLSKIKTPTLIVNALNDPFLPDACYPFEVAKTHPAVHLETPVRGGHVGFSLAGKKENWMEARAFDFISTFANSL